MSKDFAQVYIAHPTREGDIENPDAVHAVDVSALGDYLKIMFGPEVPYAEEPQILAASLLGAMAIVSTDERLDRLRQKNPTSYLPYLIRVFPDVIERTFAIREYIDGQFQQFEEDPSFGFSDQELQDIAYMMGLFDVASFVVSTFLDIEHPRYQNQALRARTEQIMTDEQKLDQLFHTIEFIGLVPMLTIENRQKLIELRRQGAEIIQTSEAYVQATLATMQARPAPETNNT